MTCETQVSDLIGSPILGTAEHILENMQPLIVSQKDSLSKHPKFKLNENEIALSANDLETALDHEIFQSKPDNNNKEIIGILRGAWFIQLCLDKLRSYLSDLQTKSDRLSSPLQTSEIHLSFPIATCFIPNIVTISTLLGRTLILRSVHLPPPSVLERLNSLLEDPRSFVFLRFTRNLQ